MVLPHEPRPDEKVSIVGVRVDARECIDWMWVYKGVCMHGVDDGV